MRLTAPAEPETTPWTCPCGTPWRVRYQPGGWNLWPKGGGFPEPQPKDCAVCGAETCPKCARKCEGACGKPLCKRCAVKFDGEIDCCEECMGEAA